mmetsp:Transcript_36095/g.61953  ORF Transcript_36095/g.61953 Transcript_36095/m.61953 type:complete len:207 (+) Transcript_36095:116-736(+)
MMAAHVHRIWRLAHASERRFTRGPRAQDSTRYMLRQLHARRIRLAAPPVLPSSPMPSRGLPHPNASLALVLRLLPRRLLGVSPRLPVGVGARHHRLVHLVRVLPRRDPAGRLAHRLELHDEQRHLALGKARRLRQPLQPRPRRRAARLDVVDEEGGVVGLLGKHDLDNLLVLAEPLAHLGELGGRELPRHHVEAAAALEPVQLAEG